MSQTEVSDEFLELLNNNYDDNNNNNNDTDDKSSLPLTLEDNEYNFSNSRGNSNTGSNGNNINNNNNNNINSGDIINNSPNSNVRKRVVPKILSYRSTPITSSTTFSPQLNKTYSGTILKTSQQQIQQHQVRPVPLPPPQSQPQPQPQPQQFNNNKQPIVVKKTIGMAGPSLPKRPPQILKNLTTTTTAINSPTKPTITALTKPYNNNNSQYSMTDEQVKETRFAYRNHQMINNSNSNSNNDNDWKNKKTTNTNNNNNKFNQPYTFADPDSLVDFEPQVDIAPTPTKQQPLNPVKSQQISTPINSPQSKPPFQYSITPQSPNKTPNPSPIKQRQPPPSIIKQQIKSPIAPQPQPPSPSPQSNNLNFEAYSYTRQIANKSPVQQKTTTTTTTTTPSPNKKFKQQQKSKSPIKLESIVAGQAHSYDSDNSSNNNNNNNNNNGIQTNRLNTPVGYEEIHSIDTLNEIINTLKDNITLVVWSTRFDNDETNTRNNEEKSDKKRVNNTTGTNISNEPLAYQLLILYNDGNIDDGDYSQPTVSSTTITHSINYSVKKIYVNVYKDNCQDENVRMGKLTFLKKLLLDGSIVKISYDSQKSLKLLFRNGYSFNPINNWDPKIQMWIYESDDKTMENYHIENVLNYLKTNYNFTNIYNLANARDLKLPQLKSNNSNSSIFGCQGSIITNKELLNILNNENNLNGTIGDKSSNSSSNYDKCHFDMLSTLFIYVIMSKLLVNDNLVVPFKNEMQLVWILSRMELQGITFSLNRLQQIDNKIQQSMDQLSQHVQQNEKLFSSGGKNVSNKISKDTFNLQSPQQVSDLLIYHNINLPPPPPTSTKSTTTPPKIKTDASSLKIYRALNSDNQLIVDFIDSCSEYRKLSKLKSTYIKPYIKLGEMSTVSADNKFSLTCDWEHTGTNTGRLTSMNPNLQSIPKNPHNLNHCKSIINRSNNGGGVNVNNDDGGNQLQDELEDNQFDADVDAAFIQVINNINDDDYNVGNNINNADIINIRYSFQTRKDYSLVALDYSQVELRIMAIFSKDPYLLEIFLNNADVITMMATKLFGISAESITPHERDQTKRIVYGILYGIGKKSLSKILKVTEPKAAECIDKFKLEFKTVDQYINSSRNKASEQRLVETIGGRIRRLPNINSENSFESSASRRQAVNTIIQGSSADIIKMAMISIVKGLFEPLIKHYSTTTNNGSGISLPHPRYEPRLVLQIHDELVFEVPDEFLLPNSIRLDLLIKWHMEDKIFADSEDKRFHEVPFKTSLSTGKEWGNLSKVDISNYNEQLEHSKFEFYQLINNNNNNGNN